VFPRAEFFIPCSYIGDFTPSFHMHDVPPLRFAVSAQVASVGGVPQAQTMLGIMLQEGTEIAQDLKKAVKLFTQASAAGRRLRLRTRWRRGAHARHTARDLPPPPSARHAL
jgi:TPR repeat protein